MEETSKCKGLCNVNQGRKNIESIVGQIAESWINSKVQVKIHGIMFLNSKEGWIVTINTRLQETKSSYNKEQDTTTLNWESH